jgi:hypothetical protein
MSKAIAHSIISFPGGVSAPALDEVLTVGEEGLDDAGGAARRRGEERL